MASEVKRQNISVEEAVALPRRYNRNAGPHLRLPRRDFLSTVSAARLHQTTLQGRSRLTVCLGLTTAGFARRAQETPACPMPTIQSGEVALLPAAFVRTRFGTSAPRWVVASAPPPSCQSADGGPG